MHLSACQTPIGLFHTITLDSRAKGAVVRLIDDCLGGSIRVIPSPLISETAIEFAITTTSTTINPPPA